MRLRMETAFLLFLFPLSPSCRLIPTVATPTKESWSGGGYRRLTDDSFIMARVFIIFDR